MCCNNNCGRGRNGCDCDNGRRNGCDCDNGRGGARSAARREDDCCCREDKEWNWNWIWLGDPGLFEGAQVNALSALAALRK